MPRAFHRLETAGVQLAGRVAAGSRLGAPLALDTLLPGGPLEIELGFGKGRYLLRRAAEDPERRFVGVEVAGRYYRLAAERAERRGLDNLLLIRGEALYVLSTLLAARLAAAVHVYFPDPWPKSRHHKRRLFDRDTVDLVLGLLAPGGTLFFATDFLEYGSAVEELLLEHPAVEVTPRSEPWDEGPRTNYEAKYMREGRPILRLTATVEGRRLLHPRGRLEVLSALAPPASSEES